ncbi:MAG: acetyltransferase [Planctomycetia bacterium]|nr:acetyltransferase [Planctomycetia bacterium]
MTQPLIILGTSGSAYDVLDIVEAINARSPAWELVGFLDDARTPGERHLNLEVLGPLTAASRFERCLFVNVIGSDRSYRLRPQLIARTGLPADRFATLVHPQAGVSSRARFGRGVVVNFGASVAGNVTVGDHVSIGPGSVIGHDSVIGPFAMLAPAAIVSGFCQVGEGSYIGAGAMIRQTVRVGACALVGMGAVVVKDVPPGAVVVGNPARPIASAVSPRSRIPSPVVESLPVAANVRGTSLSENLSTS